MRLVRNLARHRQMLRHHVVVTALAGLAAVLLASCGAGEPAEPAVVALVATQIDVGGALWRIAVDGDVVWVSDASRATLLELDAATGRLRREGAIGAVDPRAPGSRLTTAGCGRPTWAAASGL